MLTLGMIWYIVYYNEKVKDWIDNMPIGMKAYYIKITERLSKVGSNLGLPFTRSMGDGLFELRIKAKEGICRIFFCNMSQKKQKNIVMLHGFIKKSQKTPKKEIKLARQRQQAVRKL